MTGIVGTQNKYLLLPAYSCVCTVAFKQSICVTVRENVQITLGNIFVVYTYSIKVLLASMYINVDVRRVVCVSEDCRSRD
jgi:hypothetical protein